MATIHQDAALKVHRRRFRIDGQQNYMRLKVALQTVSINEEALILALDRIGCAQPEKAALEMRCALRLLVEGPAGEFR